MDYLRLEKSRQCGGNGVGGDALYKLHDGKETGCENTINGERNSWTNTTSCVCKTQSTQNQACPVSREYESHGCIVSLPDLRHEGHHPAGDYFAGRHALEVEKNDTKTETSLPRTRVVSKPPASTAGFRKTRRSL